MDYTVYILKCHDDHPYVGYTNNLKDRLERHVKGHVPATVNRLPVDLVTFISFDNKYRAFNFEKYLKSGFGRAFMRKHLI